MGLISISVLTPSYNRARYLERVWAGLQFQSYRGFEWIVGDDGSTDQTESVVRQLADSSGFPVTYIRADRHVGKIRMDNEAVRQAKGELILWCDSDDWLLPNALERLWETWNSIPDEQRCDFVGMTAFAATEDGCIVSRDLATTTTDVSWNDLSAIYGGAGDLLICVRADILKANPFPEVDLVIPESVVWSKIGHHPARLIAEVLLMKEYCASHAISFSGAMSYSRGRAYALAASVNNSLCYPRSWKLQTWQVITFIRYSLHGEIGLVEALRLWGKNSSRMALLFAFPLACLLAVKDRLQGKVIKTHRQFMAASDTVKITCRTF